MNHYDMKLPVRFFRSLYHSDDIFDLSDDFLALRRNKSLSTSHNMQSGKHTVSVKVSVKLTE